jgi:hypothetical protein
MPYILKPGQEAFEVVDGPFAGNLYQKGVRYDAVPEQDASRFDKVRVDVPAAATVREPKPESATVSGGVDSGTAPDPDKPTQKRSQLNA